MPRLYGAPAYHRPRRHAETRRPFDPDDLPLEAHRSAADEALLREQLAVPAIAEQLDEHGGRSFLRRSILAFGSRGDHSAGRRR